MKLTESTLRQLIRQVIREEDSPKRKPGDVWQSERTGNWQAMDASGNQESFGNDKEAAERYANPDGGEDKEKPEPKQTKIAADPFADKEEKPKAEPKAKISSVNDISAKDLESGDFDTWDDDDNYLGSEGYDTEELMYEEPPDLKGINNKTDSKILKQKFIDSKLYLDMIGARIEDMEDDDYDEEDIEWEQDEWKKFKGVQNNIVKFLKQKSSGGGMMGATGHRTKGRQGSGMYDAKNYGKENNLVEQIKEEFKQYGFINKLKAGDNKWQS